MNPIDDPKPIKPGDVIAMDGPPIYAEAARSTEDLAREAGFDAYANGAGGVTIQAPDDGDDLTAEVTKLVALVRAQALEDAARVCDVTPPYPFRPSIEAAHAIRALKEKP